MNVHPDIAALRGNRAPQRHAQSAMQAACDAWRNEKGAGELMDEIVQLGAGAQFLDLPQLRRVFEGGEAARLINLLSRQFCTAIGDNPIGHPPFRNGFDGKSSSILLARSGRVELMIQSIEPAEIRTEYCSFSAAKRWDVVLGGKAKARLIEVKSIAPDNRANLEETASELCTGSSFQFDLAEQSFQLEQVSSRLVVLRLLLTDQDPWPTREYDRKTGEFLHQSAGALANSRQEAIINLLGRMGRDDAAPALASLARATGDMSMRWQAIRECLSLDSGEGFGALTFIALTPEDPLQMQADNLRKKLLKTYPQLQQLEAA